jgi:hypothetical protein
MIAGLYQSILFPILFTVVLLASIAGGYFYAHRRYLKRERTWRASGVENGIIGFYGLLLSFALLTAGNLNKERNTLIYQHVDGLGNLYRRSLLMPDSTQAWVQRNVVHLIRLKTASINADRQSLARLQQETEEAYTIMWKELAGHSFDEQDITEITHDLAVLHSIDLRIGYGFQERTPTLVMIVLRVGSWLVGILIGFTSGFNPEHSILVPLIFFILTDLTMLTITDLDNPVSGFIRPSYGKYLDLEKLLMP